MFIEKLKIVSTTYIPISSQVEVKNALLKPAHFHLFTLDRSKEAQSDSQS